MCVMALGLIGGVIGAVGSLVGAQQQAQAANNQAAIYARQAAAERAVWRRAIAAASFGGRAATSCHRAGAAPA